MKHLLLISALFILSSCAALQSPVQSPVSKPDQPAPAVQPVMLQWEVGNPERAAWTQALLADVKANLSSFDKAKDMGSFCAKYGGLNADDKAHVVAVIFEWVALYESAWDPKVSAVDVGKDTDKNTYSVGLLQMSVVDQQSYNLKFGYTFADLQDPVKNLNQGVAIMAFQLEHVGLLAVPVGGKYLYWATLHPGGKFDHTKDIQAKTKGLDLCK